MPEAPSAGTCWRTTPPFTRFALRVSLQEAAQALASPAAGIPLATTACRSALRGDWVALWLGPDEQLLLGTEDGAEAFRARLATALQGIPHSLVDISHRQVAIDLSGPHAAALIKHRLSARSRPGRVPRRRLHAHGLRPGRHRALAPRHPGIPCRDLALLRALRDRITRQGRGGIPGLSRPGPASAARPPQPQSLYPNVIPMTRGRSGVCATMNCWALMKVLAFESARFSPYTVRLQRSLATPNEASTVE